MRTLLAGLVVVGAALGTANAKEGWKSLTGKPCPAWKVETWLNTDGAEPTPKTLMGKVWMLEFLSVG